MRKENQIFFGILILLIVIGSIIKAKADKKVAKSSDTKTNTNTSTGGIDTSLTNTDGGYDGSGIAGDWMDAWIA